jgi:hypothetical protein
MTFEEARKQYGSDEQMARVLFAMLQIQEAKLELHETKTANQAQNKRRENRG